MNDRIVRRNDAVAVSIGYSHKFCKELIISELINHQSRWHGNCISKEQQLTQITL